MMNLLRQFKCRLLGAALALIHLAATAQTPEGVVRKYPEHQTGYRCAFDSAQQAAFARQPGAAAAYRAFLQDVARMPATTQARLLAAPDVTVPISASVVNTSGQRRSFQLFTKM